MPDPPPDFRASWISSGKRYNYSVTCNCPAGAGHAECMEDCEAGFDDDVAALKLLHPED